MGARQELMDLAESMEITNEEAAGYGASMGLNSRDQDEVSEVFRSWDTNKDGVIDQRELGVCLRSIGLSANHVDHILRLSDKNGDGRLDFEEFLNWIFATANDTTKEAKFPQGASLVERFYKKAS